MVKAIWLEVCLPVVNDVMGSNAHVVSLPLLLGESAAQFICLLSPADLILFGASRRRDKV